MNAEVKSRAAVVLGGCAHGLATSRALWRFGVPVYMLESDTALPGASTRSAKLVPARDINGPGLIDALLELDRRESFAEPPVLFPVNDNMVRVLCEHWDALDGRYALSWVDKRNEILPYLDKMSFPPRCAETGIHYPRTENLHSLEALEGLRDILRFPLIVKPDRPLSGFKTQVVHSFEELAAFAPRFESDLPFILQEFIDGDDTQLVFCVLYLRRGEVLAHFEGRKIRSIPPGWTTVAQSYPDEEVREATERFFAGMDLSGPVSGEFKRGPDGTLWFLEATLGRTDFWLGCAIANGVDIPVVAYCDQCGLPMPPVRQRHLVYWYNTDRDPLAPYYAMRTTRLGSLTRGAAFQYLTLDDIGPFAASLGAKGRYYLRAAGRRLGLGTMRR